MTILRVLAGSILPVMRGPTIEPEYVRPAIITATATDRRISAVIGRAIVTSRNQDTVGPVILGVTEMGKNRRMAGHRSGLRRNLNNPLLTGKRRTLCAGVSKSAGRDYKGKGRRM